MEIVSGKTARAVGLKRYYTGRPCKRGHVSERYSSGACIACVTEQHAAQPGNPEWRAAREALQSAKVAGAKRYITGSPCKRGHTGSRLVSNQQCVECTRDRRAKHEWESANPKRVAVNVKASACRRAGIECDRELLLSLPCPVVCPVFGTPISFERGKGQRPQENVASFDRIDPRRGYVRGNVQIISMKANAMKNDATPEQLTMFVRWVQGL